MIFHKDRAKWKTCRICMNTRESIGDPIPYCKYSCRNVKSIFGWKTWDECVYFDWNNSCRSCNKYDNCPKIKQALIADKVVDVGRGNVCDEYEPIPEMREYVCGNKSKKLKESPIKNKV